MLDAHQHLLLIRAEMPGTTGRHVSGGPAGTPARAWARLAGGRRLANALRIRRAARTTMDPAGGLRLG
jgi:hypothetical protein